MPADPALAAALLAWYDVNARRLPWRAPPGEKPDPYRVWLSEVMLQQTTVAAAAPYFERFLARWPRLEDLAAARLEDILAAWAGLGYYARARNLHRCAQLVMQQGGRFPESAAELARLPGVGPYTAGAIAAIAFGAREAAIDGNVERVVTRLDAIETPIPDARAAIRDRILELLPEERSGDFAQALMDLGATVCTPRAPRCGACPWRAHCKARKDGTPEHYPVKAAPPAKPRRKGIAFWAERDDGAVLLRRRPARGLLGGMLEFPWTDTDDAEAVRNAAPGPADWRPLPGRVRHVFTHFRLELEIRRGRLETAPDGAFWARPETLPQLGLPTLMRKIAAHVAAAGSHGEIEDHAETSPVAGPPAGTGSSRRSQIRRKDPARRRAARDRCTACA